MENPQLIQIYIILAFVVLGYVVGTITEKRHYKSIKEREKQLIGLPAVTIKNAIDKDAKIEDAFLVTGNAVISLDYFKRLLAGLYNIFGGEVKSYETLIDRARREALLRMKDQAAKADIILNVRIETSAIGQSADKRKTVGSIEAIAYGTAVFLQKNEVHA
jgi:uncharacterized protein YbjQ (UPF0145 family)